MSKQQQYKRFRDLTRDLLKTEKRKLTRNERAELLPMAEQLSNLRKGVANLKNRVKMLEDYIDQEDSGGFKEYVDKKS